MSDLNSVPVHGVKILDGNVFHDLRGSFTALWQEGSGPSLDIPFLADAFLLSFNPEAKTLRGLHYQHAPKAQAKLVTCLQGSIFDVILDLRPESPSYLKWQIIQLKGGRPQAIYIPAGCAHGFLTLESNTSVAYLTEGAYAPELTGIIRWNDPAFSIPWPATTPILSEKDRMAPDFKE